MPLYPYREGSRLYIMSRRGPVYIELVLPEERRQDKETKEFFVRGKCGCCRECWIQITGPKAGLCSYGGPYNGYQEVPE